MKRPPKPATTPEEMHAEIEREHKWTDHHKERYSAPDWPLDWQSGYRRRQQAVDRLRDEATRIQARAYL
jgi:hypothetical protein